MPEAHENHVEQSVDDFRSAKDGLEASELVPQQVSNELSVEDDKESIYDEFGNNEAEPVDGEPEVEEVHEEEA